MHIITVDRPHNLVHVVLTGTMTVAEVHAYMDDLGAAMARERIGSGYRIIIDVGGCTIQTQEMIGAMRGRMVSAPKAGAIAVVSGSALARLQIRRLFAQDYARTVATEAAARAWVLDGIEPQGEDRRHADPTAAAARA